MEHQKPLARPVYWGAAGFVGASSLLLVLFSTLDPRTPQFVDLDYVAVPIFFTTLALLASVAVVPLVGQRRQRPVALVVCALALAGGIVDTFENAEIARHLADAPSTIEQRLTLAKFVIASLLLGLAVVGMAARFARWWRFRHHPVESRRGASTVEISFSQLLRAEGRDDTQPEHIGVGPFREPWLRTTVSKEPVVGLALSGGGIRSATFGLGLLQALKARHLLDTIHYLSSVSGGGYVGGFWSTCLRRLKHPTGALAEESPQIAHLRRFSRFLVPRRGFFEAETWSAVTAIFGGLLPSVSVAVAVLATAMVGWVVLTALAVHLVEIGVGTGRGWIYAGTVALLTLIVVEMWWRVEPSGRLDESGLSIYWLFAIVATLLTMGAYVLWLDALDQWTAGSSRFYLRCEAGWFSPDVRPTLRAHLGLASWSAGCLHVSPRLFDLAVSPALAASALLFGRFLLLALRTKTPGSSGELHVRPLAVFRALDRVVQRLLAIAAVIVVGALLWEAARNILGVVSRTAVLGGAAGSAGLFALLRNWMLERLTKPRAPGAKSGLLRLTPQVLAVIAVVLWTIVVAGVLIEVGGDDAHRWSSLALATLAVLGLGLLLDPHELGLHAFYRARISRAYLGASNESAAPPTITEPTKGDDLYLTQLGTGPPLHLVCTAANDLGGDQMPLLHRGARSATLSRAGVAIAGRWSSSKSITLADALTASAAAFNSNMGSVSAKLGPAVTFLLSAMNLRLGLWVQHPAAGSDGTMPAGLFYRELFQRTRSEVDQDGRPFSSWVHLSDGGHFENLALYELVRRHCRYIIVSDGGADPDLDFNDFGNAVRRIREDFGVEIEIDLLPLKRDAQGCSRQHAVVGTIRYDDQADHGILIYIKPTLTGDEPVDIQHYRAANPAFPHESTVDQFYDEAQWEAYRRLGEHTVETVFRFIDERRPPTANAIFSRARWAWYPTPPDLETRVLEQTGRYHALEAELTRHAPDDLVREFFPELNAFGPAVSPRIAYSERAVLESLLKILQLMEDVHRSCHLATAYNHPFNMGWVNFFARWAGAPSFQRWWPLLKPLYSSDLAGFLERRLPQLAGRAGDLSGQLVQRAPAPGMAHRWLNHTVGPCVTGPWTHVYEYMLQPPAGQAAGAVQVGIVLLQIDWPTARWRSDLLFVPPNLWGTGLGSRMLTDFCEALRNMAVRECRVEIVEQPYIDSGAVAEHADLVTFYRQSGFRPAPAGRGEMLRRLR